MLLSELVELAKITAGQHEIDLEELDLSKYKLMLERRVLPVTNRHLPYTADSRVVISQSPYIFTEVSDINIPKWISNIAPIGNTSAINSLLLGGSPIFSSSSIFRGSPVFSLGDIQKGMFLWRYVPPNLYTQYSGDMLVTACYATKLTETDSEDYTISLINEKAIPYAISLLAGHAMVGLGRGRRAAKVIDLPIEYDADSLIAEGSELIREATAEIQQNNDFYLAIVP